MMKRSREEPEVARPVGIWIRVSTEDQAKGESPEHHERRARAYAESRDWHVREVYRLDAVSGKSVMGHPETERMLKHLESGHIEALIFSKLARLARNTRELLDFADLFREHEADLVSLQESIDTSTPAGRLFYTVIAAMAQWEREEIADRVAASVPIRAKMGKSTGGSAPFGYQWQSHQLIPRPEEAPIRKLIYELFLEHKRKKAVARVLNERGYRTRNGSRFTDTTVERLVRDPTAKGLRRANYTRSTGQNKQWKLKPAKDWVFTPVEAIVSEELWAQCNAILDDRHSKRRLGRPPAHLFTGFAFCHCGHKLYVPSNSPKYVCYRCRNKIAIQDLEGVFLEQLKGFFLSPDDIGRYLGQADDEIRAREEQLQALESERVRVTKEKDRIYRAYVSDELSVQAFGSSFRPLEERLNQFDDEIPRIQGEVDFLKIRLLSRDEFLSGAQSLFDRWPTLTQPERRQIVEAIVERIEVAKDEVSIHLAYSPSPSQMAVEGQRFNRGSSPRPVAGGRESARRGRRG